MTKAEAVAMLKAANPTDIPWSANPSLTQRQAVQIMLDAIADRSDDWIVYDLLAKNVKKACRP